MLHSIRRFTLYTSFLILNALCLIVSVVANDGCTKCPMESNEQRWSLAISAFWVWVWPFAFLMIWIGIKSYRARNVNRSQAPLVSAAASGFVLYASAWAGDAGLALKCGKDCLPAPMTADVFLDLSPWVGAIGLIGLFGSYLWHKSVPTEIAH